MEFQDIFANYGIPLAIGLTLLAAGLAILFGIVYTIANLIFSPGETMKGLLGVIIMLGIILVAWLVSTGDQSGIFQAARYSDISVEVMRMVEAGILTTFIFSGIAIASIFLMELFNLVR